MAPGHLDRVLRRIRTWIGSPGPDEATDGQLLERFHAAHDEAAFRMLVERHGPMVLRVGQRVLTDPNDADDIFQAVFLVLARKAARLDGSRTLANWLYTVAYRLALNLKARAVRRQAHERQVATMPLPPLTNDPSGHELRQVLDEELNRLPVKYREPLVLCYLEGKTNEQAARELGCPLGSMSWRLGHARDLLRKRLGQRGVGLASAGLATLLIQEAAAATLPPTLRDSTVAAAACFATGQTLAAGAISAQAVTLTEGALQAMFMTKLKIAAALLLTACLIGTGVLTHRALAERTAPVGVVVNRVADLEAADNAPADKGGKDGAKKEDKPSQDVTGMIVAVAADGKSFTLEVPSKTKGEAGQTVTIKLGDKTVAAYFNVLPDGARPTEGYRAIVWLETGSAETAARAHFTHKSDTSPDLNGTVAAVAADGTSVSLDVPSKTKGEEARRVEVKLNDQTVASYFNVASKAVHPTVGYSAQVWLTAADKDIAARVQFSDKENTPSRKPDRTGHVAAWPRDGKPLVVEVAPSRKGEAPARLEFKVTERTRITFSNVTTAGAKPAEGLPVGLWLEDGSTDVAALVNLSSNSKGKKVDVSGRIIEVLDKGRSLRLEVPPKNKGDDAQTVDIAITEKTRQIFSGVGPGGARLTEGCQAQVWLTGGSGNVAAEVHMQGAVSGKTADANPKPKKADQQPADNDKGKPGSK